jgi:hypothetical protein
MAILRFLISTIVLVAVVIGGLALAARFSDGPMGPFAGGEFTSGEMHTGAEPDWQFVKDTETVELQLLDPSRSRTTWILEHEGRIFIPCGYMDSTWGKLWKQWPVEAERDGRGVLRVEGTLYPRELSRLEDGPLVEPLVAELNRKYAMAATAEAVSSGGLWLFELRPREANASRT